MATDVQICSNALQLLGDTAIASLSPPDDTDAAKLAANLYPQIREWVLRSHNWKCATKRVILAPDAVAPAFDYTYAFSVPDDWLRTLQVGQRGDPVDYQIEGRKYLCDDAVFYLVYIFNNKVEATFDSMLVHMLTLAMKAAMAYPITKSTSMATTCMQELQMELKRTRAVDGQDAPPETLGDFHLLNAGLATGF